MKKRTVMVFDGDDTLWMNEWRYSKARADFFAFLYQEFRDLMPSIILLVPQYFEIDHSLFPSWGVNRGRVFAAMIQLYDRLIQHFAYRLGEKSEKLALILQKRPEHERIIYEIADQPFNFYDLDWVDGARETLIKLKDDGVTLHLLTSYDQKVWVERGKYLGVDKYFNRVKVIPGRKTKRDFIEISEYKKEPKDTIFYAIGNGEADILPALDISKRWHGKCIPHHSASPVFNSVKDRSYPCTTLRPSIIQGLKHCAQ